MILRFANVSNLPYDYHVFFNRISFLHMVVCMHSRYVSLSWHLRMTIFSYLVHISHRTWRFVVSWVLKHDFTICLQVTLILSFLHENIQKFVLLGFNRRTNNGKSIFINWRSFSTNERVPCLSILHQIRRAPFIQQSSCANWSIYVIAKKCPLFQMRSTRKW